jgi:hypothetical protein
MNWNYLFAGIGLLVAAYFIYKGLKQGPSSEKNNWEGPTVSLYVQGWGAFILCIIGGIVLVLKALPA